MIKTQEGSLLDVFCTRVQVLQGFEHVNFCPYETSLPLYSPIAPRKCPLRKVCQRVCMHLSGCACMRLLCVCAWMKGFCCKGLREIFRFPTFLPLHENAPRKVCGDTAHVHACVGLRMHAHIACLRLKKPCSQV